VQEHEASSCTSSSAQSDRSTGSAEGTTSEDSGMKAVTAIPKGVAGSASHEPHGRVDLPFPPSPASGPAGSSPQQDGHYPGFCQKAEGRPNPAKYPEGSWKPTNGVSARLSPLHLGGDGGKGQQSRAGDQTGQTRTASSQALQDRAARIPSMAKSSSCGGMQRAGAAGESAAPQPSGTGKTDSDEDSDVTTEPTRLSFVENEVSAF
jgi:hypothetical protein